MQIAVESNILQKPIVKSDQTAKFEQKNHATTSVDNSHKFIELSDFLASLLNQLCLNTSISTNSSKDNSIVYQNQEQVESYEGMPPLLSILKQSGNDNIDAEQLQQLKAIFGRFFEQQNGSKITQNLVRNKIPQNKIEVIADNIDTLLKYLKIFESTGIKLGENIEESSTEKALHLLPDFRQSLERINREEIQKAIIGETANRKNFPEINIPKQFTPNFENFERNGEKLLQQDIDQVLKVEQEKVEITTEHKPSKIFDTQLKDFGFFAKDTRSIIETASTKIPPEPSKTDVRSHSRIFYSRLEEIPQNIASILNSNIEFPARAEIVLNPKAFGMIIVEINASRNKVEIMFNVQDKEILKMLESQTVVLREKLQNAGFDNQSIDLQYKSFDKGEATYQWKQEEKQSEQELMRDFIRSFAYLKENNELDFENYLQNKLEAL